MFEAICIRSQSHSQTPIDMGFLAEAMLFYQQVRIVGNHLVIKQLISQCGAETLLELLKNGHLQISYQNGGIGITTPVHMPIVFSVDSADLQDVAPELFIKATGRSGRGRRLGNCFASMVESITFPQEITQTIGDDFASKKYIKDVVVQLLKHHAPGYDLPKPFEFAIKRNDDGFSVDTNIDFQNVNHFCRIRVPPTNAILSPRYILAALCLVRENLYLSSKYSAELAVTSVDSGLLQAKINNILSKRSANEEHIKTFQDFVLADGFVLREAINSGEKSFGDLLKVLNKATKFKTWLKNQKPDENLCKNYLREATDSTWIEKLPAKSIRWALFTGAGLAIDAAGAGGIGIASGIGLSAADAFLLDKVIKGWKPNQFVCDDLAKFLAKK